MFADVGGTPAVYAGNGGDSGFGGGGAWLIAILFLAFAGRGFGGGGCEREGIDNAELNNRIDNVNTLAEQRFNLKETCDGHMATLESKGDIIREVVESKYDTALQLKDMQAANAACCCETRTAIQQASFENQKGQWDISRQIADCCCATQLNGERNTNAIIAAQTAGTQRIVDIMTADKLESYRDKLAEKNLEISRYKQNQFFDVRLAALEGRLNPPAVPAYPACNPNISVAANCAAYGYNNNGCGCACGF